MQRISYRLEHTVIVDRYKSRGANNDQDKRSYLSGEDLTELAADKKVIGVKVDREDEHKYSGC